MISPTPDFGTPGGFWTNLASVSLVVEIPSDELSELGDGPPLPILSLGRPHLCHSLHISSLPGISKAGTLLCCCCSGFCGQSLSL